MLKTIYLVSLYNGNLILLSNENGCIEFELAKEIVQAVSVNWVRCSWRKNSHFSPKLTGFTMTPTKWWLILTGNKSGKALIMAYGSRVLVSSFCGRFVFQETNLIWTRIRRAFGSTMTHIQTHGEKLKRLKMVHRLSMPHYRTGAVNIPWHLHIRIHTCFLFSFKACGCKCDWNMLARNINCHEPLWM